MIFSLLVVDNERADAGRDGQTCRELGFWYYPVARVVQLLTSISSDVGT